jgi:erythromycin esterase-like protein
MSGTCYKFTVLILLLCACKLSKPVADSVPKEISKPEAAVPYHSLKTSGDLDILMHAIGNAKIVLLGEASHGSSEFQLWRLWISQRLMNEKKFRVVVMEADWNEMLLVNDFIKGPPLELDSAMRLLSAFKRWPTWMWANQEFAQSITWLNQFNQSKQDKEKVSAYGFDIYGVGASLDSIRKKEREPQTIEVLNGIEACFKPYWNDALKYSTAVHNHSADCSSSLDQLKKKEANRLKNKLKNEDDFIFTQDLVTAIDGEAYFRLLAQNQAAAWNVRDRHMMETVERIVDLYGRDTKIIIWAHNSHIGDAAYTDMPQRGRTNLGELLKRKYGDAEIFSVGFGMYSGKVIAAYKWGDSAHIISLPPAYAGSWEEFLHEQGADDKLIITKEMQKVIPVNRWYDQRAIGVLYHPDRPRSSYIPSYVSKRYDAFLFIDSTNAMHTIVPIAGNK